MPNFNTLNLTNRTVSSSFVNFVQVTSSILTNGLGDSFFDLSQSFNSVSSSWASSSISSSWAPLQISCSWASQSLSASWSPVHISASWASSSISSSYSISSSNLIGTASMYSQAFITTGSYTSLITTQTYILSSNENGKLIIANSSSVMTFTVPATLPQGFACTLFQSGSGQVTITGSGGVNIRNRAGLSSSYGQYSAISLLQLDLGSYLLQGDIG